MKIVYIQTSFWDDPYIQSLSERETLLFLYLISNRRKNICGIYEISEKTISNESKIPEEDVKKILSKFAFDGKVHYYKSYIKLVNHVKNMHKASPQLIKGIEVEQAKIPSEVLSYFDTPTIPYTYPTHTVADITPPPSPPLPPSPPTLPNGKGDESPVSPKKTYGNNDINKLLDLIRAKVGRQQFTESDKYTRIWGNNLLVLSQKPEIGQAEFERRLEAIVKDEFKFKNCGSLEYIYKQIKAFPVAKPKLKSSQTFDEDPRYNETTTKPVTKETLNSLKALFAKKTEWPK